MHAHNEQALSPSPTLAFGVEPGFVPYRLRQARYHALAQSVAAHVDRQARRGRQRLKLLDVGVWNGVSLRYLEAQTDVTKLELHGLDRFPRGESYVYKHPQWTLHHADLEDGMPMLPSDSFDIVICEQVLEHLHNVQSAASELCRILKPGGLAIIGVPIFWNGLHLLRKHVVPQIDRLMGRRKKRGHVQAFCHRSFVDLLRKRTELRVLTTRGFRIVSGGILRPLEHYRWWWQANRFVGALTPGLCTEVQVLATKSHPSGWHRRAQPRQTVVHHRSTPA